MTTMPPLGTQQPQLTRLGTLFLRNGMVTAQQVEQALERQRQLGGARPLGEILVAMGLITDRQRVQVIGEQWGIPVVDLQRININGDAVQLVSQELARRYTLLPIEFAGPRLIVAMLDPLNVRAIDELRLVTGRDILPGIAPEDDDGNAASKSTVNASALADYILAIENSVNGEELVKIYADAYAACGNDQKWQAKVIAAKKARIEKAKKEKETA
jgi:hypothetical protein